MDGACRQHAGRGAKTVQRAAPCARQHFTTDADLDAQMSGAGRPGDAHGLPDHSATRRLRPDEARTFPARAREQSRFVGAAKSLGDPRRTAAIRCRAEPPRPLTGNDIGLENDRQDHIGPTRMTNQSDSPFWLSV
jgi:hypothetical protein